MEVLQYLAITASALAGAGVGYLVRGRMEAAKRKQDALRRKNALLDRGRVAARRPEHDGEPPARIHKIRIRNERPGPPR